MELNLDEKNILCIAETGFSETSSIYEFLKRAASGTIFTFAHNAPFFNILKKLSTFTSTPLVILYPGDGEIDEFCGKCDTLAVFTDHKDAESNKMLYTIIDDEDSPYVQILVCGSEGVVVHENSSD